MDFRYIVDNLVDTFYRTDAEGRVVFISKSVQRHMGYAPEELIGRPITDLYVHPEDRDRLLATFAQDGSITDGFEARLQRKDGEVIWVSSSSRVILAADGSIAGVEGIARDITSRKHLEEVNTRLGRIVENSLNEIYVIDAQSLKFILVNHGARENIGYTLDELLQMHAYDIQPGATREDYIESLEPLINGTAEHIQFEVAIQRKDGSRYAASANWQLAQDELVPAFFAIVQDLTETNRITAQLLQTQKFAAMHQLSGGVAHDFNNLLMVLQGNLELLNVKLDGDADKLRYVEAALAGVNRAAELTHRLLSFSQQQFLQSKIHDVGAVINGMRGTLARMMSKDITVRIETQPLPGLIEVDERLLETAIVNLCRNAGDAMPQGGTLTLRTTSTRAADETGPFTDGIAISVADEGVGMSPEIQDRIFEPFFSTKDRRDGTGLGLSMVHGFVQQSKGQITLDSTADVGTIITLHFALARPNKSTEQDAGTTQKYAGGSEVVLIVEDPADHSSIPGEFLSSVGYDVHTAADRPAVEELLQAGLTPDILIAASYEIADLVTARCRACKVLLMSQSVQPTATKLNGPYAHLTLPTPYSTLTGRIRTLLDDPAN